MRSHNGKIGMHKNMQKKVVYALMVISVTVLIINSTSFSNQDADLKVLQSELLPQEVTITNIIEDLQNNAIDPVNYLNNIVKEITEDSSIYDLIGFSIGMVIYGIFVYHFYKFLSKRDMFSINLEQRMTHIKLKSSGKKISTAPRVVAFIATNIFIFPFVIFLWFLGYSSFMFLLVQQMPTATIFLVSSSLIVAIRISAYYSEDLSKDLAKLIPFALLGIFLFNPQFYSINDVVKRLEEIPSFIILIASFLVLAMVVETILSILYLIKLRFFHKEKKAKNVNDSESAV